MNRISTATLTAIGGVILGLTVSGCSGRTTAPESPSSVSPTNDTRHSVQSDRLRQIMDEIDKLSVNQWPQEVQSELAADEQYHAAKAFWEARQLADGLSRAAASIPNAIKTTKLSEVDRRSFLAQVQTLRDQGTRLKQTAALGDREGMRRTLADLDETCNSCHSRFRDIAGDMPRR